MKLKEDLNIEKKKRRSRDKLLVRMWKGMKISELKASDAQEFSFLSGMDEEELAKSSTDEGEASS